MIQESTIYLIMLWRCFNTQGCSPTKRAMRASQFISCLHLRTLLTALCSSKPFQLLRGKPVCSVIPWGVTVPTSCSKPAAGQVWWLKPDLQRASWQLPPFNLFELTETDFSTSHAHTPMVLPRLLSHHHEPTIILWGKERQSPVLTWSKLF